MRVLFDHPLPFVLAHGGFQIQIEQTARALQQIGVDVEFVRWWDDSQRGDILHYFGRPWEHYIALAQRRGFKVIVGDLLTEMGSRSRRQRQVQKAVMQAARRVIPLSFRMRLAWDAYRLADGVVALTGWEAQLITEMFGAARERVHVVPNGVEEVFFNAPPKPRGQWLVCTATITERKRVVELAEAAVAARVPVWIVGKPYSENDPYFRRFERLARTSPALVRFEGGIQDRQRLARIYREARGFVLLSTMESLSLSALEAAACECPLLLSDLPWARTVFGDKASYCPVTHRSPVTAQCLKEFYDRAPHLPMPGRPASWIQVAGQLHGVYERVLSTSR